MSECVFCDIMAGVAPATVVRDWPHAVAIAPLNPVVEGHVLVLPRTHVSDMASDPDVSAHTMRAASLLAAEMGDCNIITSRGRAATQSVFHLHLHLIPRKENDGLALPWYSGKSKGPSTAPAAPDDGSL